jgi:hypothetical protein
VAVARGHFAACIRADEIAGAAAAGALHGASAPPRDRPQAMLA